MAASRSVAILAVLSLLAGTIASGAPKKKKKEKKEKEEVTQVLELPKDPPQAIVAEVQRLVFHSAPLSAKGLLSQQVRDGLKSLLSSMRGAQMVSVRAFVAGSGDVRRVQAIVSEELTEKRMALPTITVVQAGALPLEGAQVALQSIAVDRREANPAGLAFIPAQPSTAKESAAALIKAFDAAGSAPDSARRITCYMNSVDHLETARSAMAAAFPKIAPVYVQLRRDSTGDFTACEAVGALTSAPARSPEFRTAGDTHVALLGPGRIAITGAQMAFGKETNDIQLAYERLGKAIDGVGASWSTVASLNTYAVYNSLLERSMQVRQKLIDPQQPTGNTSLVFEGLPSLDALLAVDAIAVVAR